MILRRIAGVVSGAKIGFLIILSEIGGSAKVDANVFRSLWNSPETFTERHKAWIRKQSLSPAIGRSVTFARSTRMDSTLRMSKTASWSPYIRVVVEIRITFKLVSHGGVPSSEPQVRTCTSTVQFA